MRRREQPGGMAQQSGHISTYVILLAVPSWQSRMLSPGAPLPKSTMRPQLADVSSSYTHAAKVRSPPMYRGPKLTPFDEEGDTGVNCIDASIPAVPLTSASRPRQSPWVTSCPVDSSHVQLVDWLSQASKDGLVALPAAPRHRSYATFHTEAPRISHRWPWSSSWHGDAAARGGPGLLSAATAKQSDVLRLPGLDAGIAFKWPSLERLQCVARSVQGATIAGALQEGAQGTLRVSVGAGSKDMATNTQASQQCSRLSCRRTGQGAGSREPGTSIEPGGWRGGAMARRWPRLGRPCIQFGKGSPPTRGRPLTALLGRSPSLV